MSIGNEVISLLIDPSHNNRMNSDRKNLALFLAVMFLGGYDESISQNSSIFVSKDKSRKKALV